MNHTHWKSIFHDHRDEGTIFVHGTHTKLMYISAKAISVFIQKGVVDMTTYILGDSHIRYIMRIATVISLTNKYLMTQKRLITFLLF